MWLHTVMYLLLQGIHQVQMFNFGYSDILHINELTIFNTTRAEHSKFQRSKQ